MQDKKGVVTFSLFALILVLFILLLGFTYYLYSVEKHKYSTLLLKQEVFFAKESLFDSMIQSYILKNATVFFYAPEHPNSIKFYTNPSSVLIVNTLNDEVFSQEFSLLGMQFCSKYSFIAAENVSFLFNGSCIVVS
jgi:hypothetical protein